MQITPLAIPGLLLIEPRKIGDDRGFFSETFRTDRFNELAGPTSFVQDNHSLSSARGTLRGLHFQRNPQAQGKLVRVTRGSVLDVAVDIRHGSPHYGQHVAVELSASNWKQLYVPPGFLHGFCTLEEYTEVIYKVTAYYSAEHDAGVRWNDPAIGIRWPVDENEVQLSAKDKVAPLLSEIGTPFVF